MQAKAIVVILDILGYEKLVEERINDVKAIKYIDDSLHAVTLELLKALRESKQNIIDEAYFKKIITMIKVRCIFDNVIFSLPLTYITFSSREFDKNTTVIHCIDAFFFYVAMASTLIISKISHLHRGGFAVGYHYESERENYLFIFSEAHNKAVRLERAAEHPRILLDDSLKSFLEEISYPHMDKFFYKDARGYYCFDIYSCFELFDGQKIVQTLTEIQESLISHMEKYAMDKDVLPKLIYFAKYHNRKVSSDGLNFPDLAIDIDKFVKRRNA